MNRGREMRLFQVHNRYRFSGGEDTVVEAEASLLRSAGHSVEQIQVKNPQGAVRAATNLTLAPWNPFSYLQVKSLAEQRDFDVAHVHNTWFSFSPSIVTALARAEVPVIATMHNYRLACIDSQLTRDGKPCQLCVGRGPWQGVRYRCYRQSFAASLVAATTLALNRQLDTWRRLALVLVPSEYVHEILVRSGFDSDRVLVKPHFAPDPGPRLVAPSRSQRVLFVGRLSEEKGIEQLAEAWLAAGLGDLRLEVVGDGPLRRFLETTYPFMDIKGQLTAAEVRSKMLSARCLVFPSIWPETQGMVLLEALAAGLPVLASDIGAGRIPPSDVSAWADRLETLRDGAMVDEAGIRARQVYEGRFTPSIGLENLEVVYRLAVNAGCATGVPKNYLSSLIPQPSPPHHE